ncbi:16S rRNA (cytosine(967)-C(5))-methyltransferase [Chroococcus sp. FPU101]|uniref:16S rRNA (cytosine(967)-C(5))-methyltransferase n=1 Tax=Chroococcus sp. FPU101 TaxID=1974212 RepID=UPI001A8EFD75|nr:16S rRNA (cytosine(967)-C(5))-methyltransferase [Chroococcus sp. FPU101]GFE70377.1 sun protein [Chroococcus sp. FPU101]
MQTLTNSRQLSLVVLREIYRREAYTDVALDQGLKKANLSNVERNLATELVYGIVRRQRTLDALIDQLGKKKANQQPPDLRIILQIGLYQLRYLTQIPESAAVNTTVDLAKKNGFTQLSGVVNGLLRAYARLAKQDDPLILSVDPVQRLGILYSFPDWMIKLWIEQLGQETTESLCEWFNQSPLLDLRINPLKTTLKKVQETFLENGIKVSPVAHLPQALRLISGSRSIVDLPGFEQGWFTVQDSSAQLVTHLLGPQIGETIIDACAAPGGKTTHIAELMEDDGIIWACDRSASRLKKLQENQKRLNLRSIRILTGDSRQFSQFLESADRVLLDAPCSGLGTLHKRPDLRFRQTPERINELVQLQQELLEQTASWVKPKGILVYATCTLNSVENERVIENFLKRHPNWMIQPPSVDSFLTVFATEQGWLKVLPNRHQMDGFFIVKLVKGL